MHPPGAVTVTLVENSGSGHYFSVTVIQNMLFPDNLWTVTKMLPMVLDQSCEIFRQASFGLAIQ